MSEQAQEEVPTRPSIFGRASDPRVTPALNKAVAAVQKEMANVQAVQTADAGSYSYKYAGLEDINPMILPLLGKNGLAWVTRPTMEGEHFVLLYELRHESGQMLDGRYPLHFAGGPQAVGKEITYARRYALCAVLGIGVGGDDDDGQTAQKAVKEQPAPAQRRAARPAKPKAGDAESETAAAQRRKYHVLREQLSWDEQTGHDFISDLSDGRAERWTDLDTPAKRGAVLDKMQDEIDTLNQVGAAFPTADEEPES